MSIKQKLSLMKQDANLEWSIFIKEILERISNYKTNIKDDGFRIKHIFWGLFLSLITFSFFLSTLIFIVGEILGPIVAKISRSIWNFKLTR